MSMQETASGLKIAGADTGIEVKRAVCDICNAGCWADAYVKNGVVVKVEGCKAPGFGSGYLCAKGHASRQYIYHEDRLTVPLRRSGARGGGKFVPVSWEEALSETAERLDGIRKLYGGDSVAFYSGAGGWHQVFLERFAHSFGSVNFGSEGSMSGQAAVIAGKISAGTGAEPDLENAGVLLMWGCNQYSGDVVTEPPALAQKRRGMKIIVVDPRTTVSTYKLGDQHLHIRPGTDAALAHGLARIFIHSRWIDTQFIQEHVYGFPEYASYVERFDLKTVSEITGLPERKIRNAARLIMGNGPLAVWKSDGGITQQKNGMQTCRAIDALCAITGNFDRKGGMLPVGWGSNLNSGAAELDTEGFVLETSPRGARPRIGSRRFPLWAKYAREFQTMDLPRQILSSEPYPVRALCAFGMNAGRFPNNREMYQALGDLDFFVTADLFSTPTTRYADIVFPACSSFERGELRRVGNSLYYTKPVIFPPGEARPDTDIICSLAETLKLGDDVLRGGTDACWARMMRRLPYGIEAVKRSDEPILLPRLRRPEPGEYTSGGFSTPTGKYELKSTVIESCGVRGLLPLPEYVSSLDKADSKEYPFILSVGNRMPFAFHSRMHRVNWLRALRPDAMADMNPSDAEALDLRQGDDMAISTPGGSIRIKANLSISILPGTVHMLPDYEEADVSSIIVSNHLDPYTGYPAFRAMRCAVRRISNGNTL